MKRVILWLLKAINGKKTLLGIGCLVAGYLLMAKYPEAAKILIQIGWQLLGVGAGHKAYKWAEKTPRHYKAPK